MQKKNTWIIVALAAVVIVVVGAYALFHDSSKTNTPSYSSTPTTSNTESQPTVVNNAVVVTATDTNQKKYLADPQGNALYTYSADTTGVSNCTSSCLSAWPAYQDKGATTGLPTDISTSKRSDNGQTQYTYKGKPLYYFESDTTGHVTGDGVSGFSVAKP